MGATSLLVDGLIIFVKHECETCVMIQQVFAELSAAERHTLVLSQDDPEFPRLTNVVKDVGSNSRSGTRSRDRADHHPFKERQGGCAHLRLEPR